MYRYETSHHRHYTCCRSLFNVLSSQVPQRSHCTACLQQMRHYIFTLHCITWTRYSFYPAIRSIGRDTKFTVCHFFHYVRLQISQSGLCRSVRNFAWRFGHISDRSSILGLIATGMAELRASTGAMAGYASRWSTCLHLQLQEIKMCPSPLRFYNICAV